LQENSRKPARNVSQLADVTVSVRLPERFSSFCCWQNAQQAFKNTLQKTKVSLLAKYSLKKLCTVGTHLRDSPEFSPLSVSG
jgi:hypothetical protein